MLFSAPASRTELSTDAQRAKHQLPWVGTNIEEFRTTQNNWWSLHGENETDAKADVDRLKIPATAAEFADAYDQD